LNRCTYLILDREREDAAVEKDGEEGVWISESTVEKARREYRACGIEMVQREMGWNEQCFLERSCFGKYRCFKQSFLRWSCCLVEEEGREVEGWS